VVGANPRHNVESGTRAMIVVAVIVMQQRVK
jgi:hypothetical protein